MGETRLVSHRWRSPCMTYTHSLYRLYRLYRPVDTQDEARTQHDSMSEH